MATRLPLDLELLRRRLGEIEEEIARRAAGPVLPRVVLVSKYLSPEDCRRLRDAGHGPLGENRAADLEEKVDPGEDRDGWHFIGHLQRNKASIVLPRISCLHSLESERLAGVLDRWQEERSTAPLSVLVQVNIAGEGSKSGLAPFQAEELLPEWIDRFRNLRFDGLMAMAPFGTPEESRPVFRALRELRDRVRAHLDDPSAERFRELSMGMSGDYPVAVEEGATLLRIGRILYTPEAS